ncbi:MAG: hypothetical protein ACOC5R_05895 [Elusimicrobiota bacterium]
MKDKILKHYDSFKDFSSRVKINYPTLISIISRENYHHLAKIKTITKTIEIGEKNIFQSIQGFRAMGSHRKKPVVFPR